MSHLTNLLGAFVTSVTDDIQLALEDEIGATGARPAALLAVDTWPNCSIDFLASVLDLSHSGSVRLLDHLEDEGFVERRAGADGRTAALSLTQQGRAVVRRARRARDRLLSGVVEQLTPAERRMLGQALDRVLRAKARSRVEAQHACRFCDHSVCRGKTCPIGASAND